MSVVLRGKNPAWAEAGKLALPQLWGSKALAVRLTSYVGNSSMWKDIGPYLLILPFIRSASGTSSFMVFYPEHCQGVLTPC